MEKVTGLMQINSIYTRLLLAFSFLSITISVLYGVLVYYGMKYTEDDILNQRVSMEAAHFLQSYREDTSSATLPSSVALQSFLSTSPDLPEWLADQPNGSRELHDREVHISVSDLPDGTGKLFIVLSELDSSNLEGNTASLLGALVLVGILITLVGLSLGIMLGKYVSAPIIALTHGIAGIDPHAWQRGGQSFHGVERSDEVGALSRSFAGLLTRIGEFIAREKQFTRYASHELRTPVSIIRNSMAVIRLPDVESAVVERNLQRIEHSAHDMETLISTFLHLGRENARSQFVHIPLDRLLKERLAHQSVINEDHRLQLELDVAASVSIDNDANLVQILIDNVLRNMFHHGKSWGSVALSDTRLVVENDTDPAGAGAENREHYGLEIVERISKHCGFTTEYRSDAARFTMTIYISSGASIGSNDGALL